MEQENQKKTIKEKKDWWRYKTTWKNREGELKRKSKQKQLKQTEIKSKLKNVREQTESNKVSKQV